MKEFAATVNISIDLTLAKQRMEMQLRLAHTIISLRGNRSIAPLDSCISLMLLVTGGSLYDVSF